TGLSMVKARWREFAAVVALVLFVGPGVGAVRASEGSSGSSGSSGGGGGGDPDIIEGQRVTLQANVQGGVAPFRYQWFKNGVPLPDADEPVLLLAPARVADSGVYSVIVFNDYGSVVSPPEIVTVKGAPLNASRSRLANVSMVVASGNVPFMPNPD